MSQFCQITAPENVIYLELGCFEKGAAVTMVDVDMRNQVLHVFIFLDK